MLGTRRISRAGCVDVLIGLSHCVCQPLDFLHAGLCRGSTIPYRQLRTLRFSRQFEVIAAGDNLILGINSSDI